MNTPAHLLLGAAVMGREGAKPLIWAALAGALLPDLSLYLMAGFALYVQGLPGSVVFGELYYSDLWQTVFSIDNSFIVWGALLALAVWRQAGWAVALTGAALLHLMFDLPLHHDDGRAHFWPLTGWIFESPISYWDVRHGAGWVAPVEALVGTLAAITLWWRRPGWVLSCVTLALLLAEGLALRNWIFFFGAD